MKLGYTAYGVYWALIEDLYNNDNKLLYDLELLAFDFRVDEEIIEAIINNFDLFTVVDGFLSSESIQRRLDIREEKSDKAKASVEKRWGKSESTIKPKDHIFYVLEIYNEEEKFIKCGMSSTSISRRFSGKLKPYDYKIIFQCEMNANDAIECESKISSLCESHEPSHKFGGYTVCYKHSSIKEMKEILQPFAAFRNTLKESKVNESKVKEIKESKLYKNNHTHLSLSDEQYEKFTKTYGEEVTDDYISRILNYTGNKRYNNLELTLMQWLKKDGVNAKPSNNCFKWRYEGKIHTLPEYDVEKFEKEKKLLGSAMKVIKTPEDYGV